MRFFNALNEGFFFSLLRIEQLSKYDEKAGGILKIFIR